LEEFIGKVFDNSYLSGLLHDAKYLLEVAKRCVKFQIYNESQSLGYGMGIYTMKYIYDDRFKGPEELLKISFPTGAYIFGEHYDKEYFKEFWEELKECEADYIDEANKELFYKPENAKKAWEHYQTVYKKYREGNKKRMKKVQLQEAKKRYEKLLAEVENG
jgi:hypothetical protein